MNSHDHDFLACVRELIALGLSGDWLANFKADQEHYRECVKTIISRLLDLAIPDRGLLAVPLDDELRTELTAMVEALDGISGPTLNAAKEMEEEPKEGIVVNLAIAVLMRLITKWLESLDDSE